MSRAPFSPATEDYLKHLYLLGSAGAAAAPKVTTQALADALGVAPASATGMLRKLADQGLVAHSPYRGARLTPEGERAALEVLRHHRLLELFLHRALGVPLDEVHEEAEALEHALSERLEARIAAWLNDPTHDPHGDPIPSLGGELPARAEQGLSLIEPGRRARIARVPDRDAEQLRALVECGLKPEAEVVVREVDRALDTVLVAVAPPPGSQSDTWVTVTLSRAVAAQIQVHAAHLQPAQEPPQ
ncbi:metal-dependent transcriptional regulator [Deinococcus lacus]|uniref:Manganese transport regulator n=1 Tax=Deinococcus lacus TaxID=392561 RepID=A0ABW1YCP0_9DEIO